MESQNSLNSILKLMAATSAEMIIMETKLSTQIFSFYTQRVLCKSTLAQNQITAWGSGVSATCAISTLCDTTSQILDNPNAVCINCHQSCLGCTVAASFKNCISCNPSYNQQLATDWKCQPTCNNTQYKIFSDGCAQCSNQCNSCSGPSNNQCLSCNLISKRTYNSVNHTCNCDPIGYADIIGLANCVQCHVYCYTCFGQLKSQCLSCNTSFTHRELINGQCVCENSYVPSINTNNPVCNQCHSTCLTCSEQYVINKCLSCDDQMHRILIHHMCICISGYFNSSVSNICEPCHITCNSCYGPASNNCIDCLEINFRYLINSNECICQEGYYSNPSTAVCQKCSIYCQTCQNEAQNCTSCNQKQNRYINGQTCKCIAKYYEFYSFVDCQPCFYTCEKCIEQFKCQSCAINANRIAKPNSQGECPCIAGYIEYYNQIKCVPCHHTCVECTINNATMCTICKIDNWPAIYANQTLSYDVITNREDLSKTNFSCPCKAGYFEVDGQVSCQKCDPYCGTCINRQFECTSCPENSFRNLVLDGFNYCPCQIGYYDSQDVVCSNCENNCKTCENSPHQCTSCYENMQLDQLQKRCFCFLGLYEDQTTLKCIACNPNCVTCYKNSTHCLTCNTTLYRILDQKSNICICNPDLHRIENSDGLCICNNYHYESKNQLCIPTDLIYNISIVDQQMSRIPQFLLTFSQNLDIDSAQFFDNLIINITHLSSNEYNIKMFPHSNKSFLIQIETYINIPVPIKIILSFKESRMIKDINQHELQNIFQTNPVSLQIFPFIDDKLTENICKIANSLHDNDQFMSAITYLNYFSFFTVLFNGNQATIPFITLNQVLPPNLYCMLKTFSPFSGISYKLPRWQELNLNHSYKIFGLQSQDFLNQESLLLNNKFVEIGFSINYLSNFSFSFFVQLTLSLFVTYYANLYQKEKEDQKDFKISFHKLVITSRMLLKMIEGRFMMNILSILLDLLSFNFNNIFKIFSFTLSVLILSSLVSTFFDIIRHLRKKGDREYLPVLDMLLYDIVDQQQIKEKSYSLIVHIECYHLYTLAKKFLWCVILVAVQDYHIQIILILATQSIFIVILIILRPYLNLFFNIVKILNELIILCIYIVLLVFDYSVLDKILDISDSETFDQQLVSDMLLYGEIAMYFFICFIGISFFISLYWIVKVTIYGFRQYKRKQQRMDTTTLEFYSFNQLEMSQTKPNNEILKKKLKEKGDNECGDDDL